MLHSLKDIKAVSDKRVVLLQSGGLDSCYLASLLSSYGYDIHHVYIDYGQNSKAQELSAAKKIVSRYGGTLHCVSLTMPWLETSTVLVNDQKVEEYAVPTKFGCVEAKTYVPLRNHVLISIAGSLAEALGIQYIASGLDGTQDLLGRPTKGTPDKHTKFAQRLEKSMSEGSTLKHIEHRDIEIIAPLIGRTKEQTITHGTHALHTHWEESWTCYNNTEKPCGECCACVDRLNHFKNAGITDPTEYLK